MLMLAERDLGDFRRRNVQREFKSRGKNRRVVQSRDGDWGKVNLRKRLLQRR